MKANVAPTGRSSLLHLFRPSPSKTQLSGTNNHRLLRLRVHIRTTLPCVDDRVQQHRHHGSPVPQYYLRGASRNLTAIAWPFIFAHAIHAPWMVWVLLQRLFGVVDCCARYRGMHASQPTNHCWKHELYEPNPCWLVLSHHAGVVRRREEEVCGPQG